MSNNQKGHPHAKSMLLYAQDALEIDKPWEMWEVKRVDRDNWLNMSGHPAWIPDYKYRRKSQTILVNGIEVPEPVRKPLKEAETYWLAVPTSPHRAISAVWLNDNNDKYFLRSGLMHLTKESAVLHAEAMLKPSTNNS